MATPKFQTDLPALPIRQDRERPRCSAPWPSYRHFWNTLGRLRQKLTQGIESCRRTQFAYRQPAVLLAVILLIGLFAGQVADADSHIPDDPDELREAYDTAFQAMYQDPADLDKATSYIELAIAIGDLEGAVAALEMMLIFEPDLPQVRMDLGFLYIQLGSPGMAQAYLSDVLLETALPDDAREPVRHPVQQRPVERVDPGEVSVPAHLTLRLGVRQRGQLHHRVGVIRGDDAIARRGDRVRSKRHRAAPRTNGLEQPSEIHIVQHIAIQHGEAIGQSIGHVL